MSRKLGSTVDLLVPANFIRAIRESGYVSLSTALAELIDNSIQADAAVIDITIGRSRPDALPWISVEDDGYGMSEEELISCLRFGGSSRFDSRSSFGRFGMGLPAASLSQARRIEVATWQPGTPARAVHLDVDAVAQGDEASLLACDGVRGAARSGCRVTWNECDRIEYRRLVWLERSLHRDLGQMFRKFLDSGTTLRINGHRVEPLDPMLLKTKVNGRSARLAFDPLRYEISTATGETSCVTVTFAMLPVTGWHHLDNAIKRRIGVTGRGGVSILRAGREIASGWYLMGGKRKENYDDWWRCEIEFDPALDEDFGITINKQGVRPTAALREALEPELESIARILNARVRQAFEEVKFEAAVQGSCRIAGAADADLPVIRTSGRAAGALSYRLGAGQLSGELMFELTLKQRCIDVTLNIDHPAFGALYRPLQELGEAGTPVRTALELMLLSFARSVASMGVTEQERRELLLSWGATYGRMLAKS
ncbi:ATP-binding protein [Microbacterium sp. ANT_H45B]|uniref:ATP-binding protein n=1 Tax=Microbacterium sp. ANT_H45B TaxID=2597346 RepID=UPI0011EE3C10|nr:ATP-binding protein [Microbacterium sp. ANT_H45B]KAA0959979.1 ATP-binding protein [Microbacterium sp. ANT_H45B]